MKTFSLHRRKLLVNGGVAIAATTLASWLPRGKAAASDPAQVPQYVVLDARYSDSRRFAAQLQQSGSKPLILQGDVLHLWRDLQPVFDAGTVSLAGMTQYSDFQILQILAAEAGARILFEAQHDCRGGTTMRHHVRAGNVAAQACLALEDSGSAWHAALANSICACPASTSSLQRHVIATNVVRAADHPGTLFSWLLG